MTDRRSHALGAAVLIAGLHTSPASAWGDAFAEVMPPPREPVRRDRGHRKSVKPKALAKRHAANKRARKARRK